MSTGLKILAAFLANALYGIADASEAFCSCGRSLMDARVKSSGASGTGTDAVWPIVSAHLFADNNFWSYSGVFSLSPVLTAFLLFALHVLFPAMSDIILL